MNDAPHAFVRIEADIKKNKISPVVLLCGVEQYLSNWAQDRLTAHFVNQATAMLDLSVFEEGKGRPEEVIAACETLPVMSSRKVVVMKAPEGLWKKTGRTWSEGEIEQFADYLTNLPQTLLLILVSMESEEERRDRGKTKLFKTIQQVGHIYEFEPLSQSDLSKFVRKRFHAGGKEITQSGINDLVSRSGYFNKDVEYSLYNLENDIQKIIFHADGPSVTKEDVTSCLSDSLEQGVFKLLDAMGAKRKEEALRLLHELLKGGDSPLRIASLITGQLEIMLAGSELRGEGRSVPQIARALKVNEFRVKKAMQAAGRYTEKDLRAILREALSIDNEIKTGYMSADLALEMFIAGI